MKFKAKEREGITLIALVITIIVLLILAGVSISMLTGEGGILTQAENAGRVTEIQAIIEEAKLDILEVIAENEGDITESELNGILAKYGTISGEGENRVITTEEGYVINVSDIFNGELTEGEDEEINLIFGGVYKGTVVLIDANGENYGQINMYYSMFENGNFYGGNDMFISGTYGKANGPFWSQKQENVVSYSPGVITIKAYSIDLPVSEDGTSFVVSKEVLSSMLNVPEGISVKDDVTFTYTGGQFAEHAPYVNSKYYFVNKVTKEDYIIVNNDGTYTVSYSQYPEYSGTFTAEQIGFISFSLDGKIISMNDSRLSLLDLIAVEENSIIWNE